MSRLSSREARAIEVWDSRSGWDRHSLSVDKALQQLVEHKCSLLHELHVLGSAVGMLAVADRILERILELGAGS